MSHHSSHHNSNAGGCYDKIRIRLSFHCLNKASCTCACKYFTVLHEDWSVKSASVIL